MACDKYFNILNCLGVDYDHNKWTDRCTDGQNGLLTIARSNVYLFIFVITQSNVDQF